MKNLELQNFGVLELDAKEMREIDGGNVPLIIWYLRVRRHFIDGFNDGSGANCK